MAGKIPQSFIYDLIERSDIVELIDARVKLKKTGRNYSACCPFHQEKTPSFSVNPDKQFFYCFGCGAGGNVISFLMDYERTSFVETIENLAHHLGIKVPREENGFTEKNQIIKRSIYDLLEQANLYFQQQLQQHPERKKALDYLQQRGLNDTIREQFGLGYAPPGWNNLEKNLTQNHANNEEQKQLLIEAGMLIEKDDQSSCYDRFRDRLMFPIRDNRGRTIAFGGRVFTDEKPKYLNSPETPVFHKQLELYGLYEARQANRHLTRLLMVEGYMDVIALAQFGITFAVATLGTSAGTAHMEKVFRHCNEVIFCFDGDTAGRKAALRALDAVIPLMEGGRQAKFLFLPEGEDPDSLVRKIGKDKFLWQMEHAQTLSEYLFELHGKNLELSRPDDKAKLINNIMPSINALPIGAFQELILRSLSEKTGLPLEDLKKLELSKTTTSKDFQTSKPSKTGFPTNPKQREKLNRDQRQIKRTPAKAAIALLVLAPELAHQTNYPLNELNSDAEDIQILLELVNFIRENPDVNTAKIIGFWQSHNKSAITRLLSNEINTDNPELQQQEFHDAITELMHHKTKENHASFIEKLKQGPIKRDLSDEEKANLLALMKK